MSEGASAEVHERIERSVDSIADEITEVSLYLHGHPELSMQEVESAALLADALDRHGWDVRRGVGGLPTAFLGSSGAGSPTVALLCEYDALPGVGHGCGHNLIAAGGLAAALALRAGAPELPGRVLCIGTPGEEQGGGKIELLRAGVFDEVDAALMFHPSSTTVGYRHATACCPIFFEFHGVSAHAAGSPTQARSALAAVIQLFVGVDSLRQFIPETSRIHGIISHGGQIANVIPDYTRAEFRVRALTTESVEELVERVLAVAEAAAQATGTTVTVTREATYSERKNNHLLAGRVVGHLARLGVEAQEPVLRGGTGSSDIGNVSLVLPAIHPYLKVAPDGTPGHSLQMADAAGSAEAQDVMLKMAKALACAAADILADGDLMRRVRAEFELSEPDLP